LNGRSPSAWASASSRLGDSGLVLAAGWRALRCRRLPRGISVPQSDKQKIRSRLRSYERKLQKEKKEHGFYRDDGALAAFEWFDAS
jgi:hypothetical protein